LCEGVKTLGTIRDCPRATFGVVAIKPLNATIRVVLEQN
jgi:hypothetical protein